MVRRAALRTGNRLATIEAGHLHIGFMLFTPSAPGRAIRDINLEQHCCIKCY